MVEAGILYSRPYLDLTPESARERVDDLGFLVDVSGEQVLCLGGGGGQQSVAFALLGARVTVLDASDAQLQQDRQAAAHYGLDVELVQGDMRDLSIFGADVFDIVYQPYSINYVPETTRVFRETARVLRTGGLYRLGFHNPYTIAVDEDVWTGDGYLLNGAYLEGENVSLQYPEWDIESASGEVTKITSPFLFRHTMGTILNGVVANGFVVLGLSEDSRGDESDIPGSWDHFKSMAVPYLSLWAVLEPGAFTVIRPEE